MGVHTQPQPCCRDAECARSPALAGALALLHLTPLHFSTSIISFLFRQAFPPAQNADAGGCLGAEPMAAGTGIYFVLRLILLLFSFLSEPRVPVSIGKSLTVQNAIPASV